MKRDIQQPTFINETSINKQKHTATCRMRGIKRRHIDNWMVANNEDGDNMNR